MASIEKTGATAIHSPPSDYRSRLYHWIQRSKHPFRRHLLEVYLYQLPFTSGTAQDTVDRHIANDAVSYERPDYHMNASQYQHARPSPDAAANPPLGGDQSKATNTRPRRECPSNQAGTPQQNQSLSALGYCMPLYFYQILVVASWVITLALDLIPFEIKAFLGIYLVTLGLSWCFRCLYEARFMERFWNMKAVMKEATWISGVVTLSIWSVLVVNRIGF